MHCLSERPRSSWPNTVFFLIVDEPIGYDNIHYLANSFLIHKSSFKIETAEPSRIRKTFYDLAHYQSPIGLHHAMDFFICFRRSERSASLVLELAHQNSVNHFFTIEIDGSESYIKLAKFILSFLPSNMTIWFLKHLLR